MVAMEFMAPTPGPFLGFLFVSFSMRWCWSGGLGHSSLALSTWDLILQGSTLFGSCVGPTITLVALEGAFLTPALLRVFFLPLNLS